MFLLDELKRQKGVCHDDDEVDELTKIINSTLDYVTQSDMKELTILLKELKERRRLLHHAYQPGGIDC